MIAKDYRLKAIPRTEILLKDIGFVYPIFLNWVEQSPIITLALNVIHKGTDPKKGRKLLRGRELILTLFRTQSSYHTIYTSKYLVTILK